MKLRKLNDLILEVDKGNPYKTGTVEYALHERFRQLLVSEPETIQSLAEFIELATEDFVVYGLSHESFGSV